MKTILFVCFLILAPCLVNPTNAQCPMCKANVERAREVNVKSVGAGLNNGIYMLLVMPYLLVGSFGAYWYYTNRKKKHAQANQISLN